MEKKKKKKINFLEGKQAPKSHGLYIFQVAARVAVNGNVHRRTFRLN